MESAVFGLVGVAIGAVLTLLREWWLQSRRDKREIEFIAVQISCVLDGFAAQCSLVVSDDGKYEAHERGEQEYRYTTVDEPKLDLASYKLEWKFLPTHIMHRVLRFPYEVANVSRIVEDVRDSVATPPDYEEYWEERQFRFAKLGVNAVFLAEELRDLAGLDKNPEEVTLNVTNNLRDALADIFKTRTAREKHMGTFSVDA